MAASAQFVTSADGTKIWAECIGATDKPCIVWVHGLSCSALPFDKQFADEEFLKGYKMIRYETRGHGRSGAPMNKAAYESARHGEDFKSVCDAFGVKECFVAGWSLGGVVAADYFSTYGTSGEPIKILGLILLAAMAHRAMHRLVVHPVFVDLLTRFIPAISFDPTVQVEEVTKMNTPASAIEEFVDSCVAPGTQDRVPIVEVWKWMGAIVTQHPLVRHYTYTRPQSPEAFMSIASLSPSDPDSLPVLAIHGRVDQHMVAAKHEAWMKENLGNLEYWMLDGVGHAPFWEAEEEVSRIIRAWCGKAIKEREGRGLGG